MSNDSSFHVHTLLAHSGRRDKSTYGPVNTPVTRASTMLFPSTQELKAAYGSRRTYARHATESTLALEEALCAAEGADACLLTPSGLAAVTTTLLALLNPGDHLLMTDSAYDPTRSFCEGLLKRMGVETTYYNPLVGAGIETLIRPNTRVIFVESPGSLTFEVQDIPAIAEVAHRHNVVVVSDSTWATPIGWAPFTLGVDVSLHAATKYIVGHSDVLMGAILTTHALHERLRSSYRELGVSISGDDAYLALRGLRTLAARLAMHRSHARIIAEWLLLQPEVDTLLYPPHESSPGHEIWKRDFRPEYACGLMGVVFKKTISDDAIHDLVNHTRLFGIGFSWGGYESLMIPTQPAAHRSVNARQWNQPMIRLHVGLESPIDLIFDLEKGFEALRHHCVPDTE